LGGIGETMGAVLLSSGVISTIAGSNSAIHMSLYIGDNVAAHNETEWANFQNNGDYLMGEKQLLLGYLSSMIASQLWQNIASYLTWPVSGTHSTICALIGFTLAEKSFDGVLVGEWVPWCSSGIFTILWGLLVTPYIAMFYAFFFYGILYRQAIIGDNPRSNGSKRWYSFCVFLMFANIAFSLTLSKQFEHRLPIIVPHTGCRNWNPPVFGILVGSAFGVVFGGLFHIFLVDWFLDRKTQFKMSFDFLSNLSFKKKSSNAEEEVHLEKISTETSELKTLERNIDDEIPEPEEAQEVQNIFRPLQAFSAFFGALSHGGNDVGNCIAPLVAIYAIYRVPIGYDLDQPALFWKFFGGMGITIGLIMFGERVILTMGTKMTPMTPSLGFVVVTSASLVIMICSLFGIPTSTTHCQVMALVGGGVARGWVDTGSFKGGLETIDLGLFKNIYLSWIATIPFTIALSAGFYSIIRVIFLGPF